MFNPYHYKAVVKSVYDADTLTIDIDLGLNTWLRNEKIRLNRINAPEITGKEKPLGQLARAALLKRVQIGQEIFIETIKDKTEKYGRYLAEIWLNTNGQWENINDWLVENGHAKYQAY